ncbi:type II toxin-antitoxin system MqsA family antitoxin [Calditrichota bacterium GD2]
MKCVICKSGDTKPGFVTVTLQRKTTTVIFKEVPAEVCENCGEYYLSEEVSEKLLTRAEEAVKKGTEIEVLKFAA